MACAVVFPSRPSNGAGYAAQPPERRHRKCRWGRPALPSLLFDPPSARELTGHSLVAVLVIGIVATAAAFVAWLYAQRYLSAVEAGVILSLEPVIAAAFSVFLGVEPWTAALTIGGLLVVAAMLVTELGG